MISCPIDLAFLVCSTVCAAAQAPTNSSGGELLPEEAAYDVRAYTLELEVDPKRRRIEGNLKLRADLLVATERIVFDLADELELGAVTLDGEPAEPQRAAHQRVYVDTSGLEAGSSFLLSIDYGGVPREAPNPPWQGGFTWKTSADGSPWIATSCQGEGADLWWPCKDHPSDEPDEMRLVITVPAPLKVASNGRLLGATTVGEGEQARTTFEWHVTTPISNYSVALNIAPYEVLTQAYRSVGGETLDVAYWVLPENVAKGRKILPEFVEHLAFYEELFGPYPFRADKYAVVETPHLGMEHQTIIAYGNQYRGDANFDYDWLHHHELAHEWWANLVTARDWNDFWIHEGIGTYCQALYLERKFGQAALKRKMVLDLRGIANQGAVAPRAAKETTWMYFSSPSDDSRGESSPGNDIYYKGSWICHSLRFLLGDESFFEVLRRWAYPDPASELRTDGSACRLTSTDELLEIAERVTQRELDWFFELYLRQARLPALETEQVAGELRLHWRTPAGLEFSMPVEVDVGGRRVRVEMPGGSGVLEVGDAKFQLDPDRWLLRAH